MNNGEHENMKNESKRWFLRVAGDNPDAATMEIHAGDPTDLFGIRRIAVISQPAGEPLIPADERLRNAHLIAAAPDLLGACKGICEAVADCLPISDEPKRIDALYYKAKLMAIDAAAAKCSAAILKAERKP